ncbi:hypothetical protein V1514DRAFT_310153 [Lipomyces japonicus]|uniref:uncharacterized protein n=1 Tax=Lipomyces japonicus TaxID=56871 RepID=UPI0034CD5DF5
MVNYSPPPNGIYVPSVTFFKKDSSADSIYNPPVDLELQLQYTLFLARNGVHGVVLFGSTGEAVHISREERSNVISFVRQGLDNEGFSNFPIIAGTASNSAVETVQLLNDAKTSGAAYALVLAPNFFASLVTQQGLVQWYSEVASRSPLPILIYYYPGVSNNINIDISTFEELSTHPNIVGTKLSHGNISHHTILSQSPTIQSNNFSVFTGLGQQLLPLTVVGGAGAIDALAGVFPKSVVRLFNLSAQGNIKAAQKAQYLVSRAEEVVANFGVIGVKEAVFRVHGWGDRDGSRLPLKGFLGTKEQEEWTTNYGEAIEDLKKFETSL